MAVPSAKLADLQNLFNAAQSEFIDRTGSDEDIRIRIAHNPIAFRSQLEQVIATTQMDTPPSSAEEIRTLLGLPLDSSNALVRQTALAVISTQQTQLLEALAAQWGVADPLVVLPHGALHISRDALDLFQAPPDFTLPDNLTQIQNPQD
jgi:hypothetical protein